jgi:hypothetical protein
LDCDVFENTKHISISYILFFYFIAQVNVFNVLVIKNLGLDPDSGLDKEKSLYSNSGLNEFDLTTLSLSFSPLKSGSKTLALSFSLLKSGPTTLALSFSPPKSGSTTLALSFSPLKSGPQHWL